MTPYARRQSAQGPLALVIVSLRTGYAKRRVDLGWGSAAALAISTKAIVVVRAGARLTVPEVY